MSRVVCVCVCTHVSKHICMYIPVCINRATLCSRESRGTCYPFSLLSLKATQLQIIDFVSHTRNLRSEKLLCLFKISQLKRKWKNGNLKPIFYNKKATSSFPTVPYPILFKIFWGEKYFLKQSIRFKHIVFHHLVLFIHFICIIYCV